MKEIELMRYLLNEIEEEIKYKEEYEKAKIKAEAKVEKETNLNHSYWWYMPDHLKRDPKKSIVQDNAKMIRRLALKLYKEV